MPYRLTYTWKGNKTRSSNSGFKTQKQVKNWIKDKRDNFGKKSIHNPRISKYKKK